MEGEEKMNYDLKRGLYVPLEKLCLLEATAAVLCEDVLGSDLELTAEERAGLVQIKEDEARHYVLARKALDGLKTVDQSRLKVKLREYREEHQRRWQGPVGRIARLHEDECLVMRYLDLFDRTINGIIPDEGGEFVAAVRNDEPRHHAWGRAVLARLTHNNEEQRRFVGQQRKAQGWPAATIMGQFGRIQSKMGLRT